MQRHTRDQCDVELPSRSMIDGGLEYYFCGGIFHWKSPILRPASCRRRCWDYRERQTDVNRETTRETDRPLEAHVGKLFWTCMSCELISSFPWSDDSGGKLVKRPIITWIRERIMCVGIIPLRRLVQLRLLVGQEIYCQCIPPPELPPIIPLKRNVQSCDRKGARSVQ